MSNKSGVPGSLRRLVMREGGYSCAICGIKGREIRFQRGGFGFPTDNKGIHLSIDHIIPKSEGGSHDRSNLRVLCTACNSKKGVSHA